MRCAFEKIPVYTADVSGVCSALFEMGGMVVIHDPSGCNSTYNTHDETRWYDQDSLIFISAISEREAIFGDDKKFIEDIVIAAEELKPRFIALITAPVPFINGTDFKAISKIIERETGIPTFFVKTNGMHSYIQGVDEAFLDIAKRYITEPAESEKQKSAGDRPSLNILGVTPLDFAEKNEVSSLRNKICDAGWDIVSCWAMGDTFENLQKAASADVNLVVSSTGYKAAVYMEEKFGIPYVLGMPVGSFAEDVFIALESAVKDGKSRIAYEATSESESETVSEADSDSNSNSDINSNSDSNNKAENSSKQAASDYYDIVLIGEPVAMSSFAAHYEKRGLSTLIVCPLECDPYILRKGDISVYGEEEVMDAMKLGRKIAADPYYGRLTDKEIIPMPHLAFSGRGFLRTMKDRFSEDYSVPE